MISSFAPSRPGIRGALKALLADESGLSTVEYCAAGGVLSGMIFMASQALKAAQAAALDRMVNPAAG